MQKQAANRQQGGSNLRPTGSAPAARRQPGGSDLAMGGDGTWGRVSRRGADGKNYVVIQSVEGREGLGDELPGSGVCPTFLHCVRWTHLHGIVDDCLESRPIVAMRRPKLIKAIYAELRRALPDLPAGDVLKLANRLLRAYTSDPDLMKLFGREVETRSVDRLPLDVALKDGGWRVMEYELHRAAEFEDLEPHMLAAIRPIIEKYLGPEWQHHSQVRPL